MINILENKLVIKSIHTVIIVVLSIIAYRMIVYILKKSEQKSKFSLFTSNKGKTYLNLLISTIRSIFIVVTILVILQTNGINVSSVLAGVGVLGVVFGLAIQDWLKDIIRGSSIISDNYFEVGNIVKYKDIEGKVLVIGLKTTKIKELKTGNVIAIANRNILEVQVVSNLIYIKIPMPYELPVVKAEKVVDEIINMIKNNNHVNDCKYKGVTDLAASYIEYFIEVDCKPEYKLQVRRDALRSILIGMENNKIEVPYTQIDIHNK
ncbi:MAG: mechanosensitive ion channel family protein [Bacilli bacterium]|nr:mechanosensitive ion channel family protein [Bacilli bacterium]